jgi:hypothetical protein
MSFADITKNVLPISVVVIFIASIIATFFINPKKFQESRSYVFVSIMASVAVVILGLNVVLNTINLEFQETITKTEITKQGVDKLWVYPNQIFTEKTKCRPEFYGSLYYNNLELYNLTHNLNTPHSIESAMEEQFVSILLFQCWEDYLTFRRFDETGDAVWLVNYIQWAQSPLLKANFDRLKYNFAELTIRLGELLFEYAGKLPVPTPDPESYKMVVGEMLNDQRLINIYTERMAM